MRLNAWLLYRCLDRDFCPPSPVLATKAQVLGDQCGGLVQGYEIVSLVYASDRASLGFACSFSYVCVCSSLSIISQGYKFLLCGGITVNLTGPGHWPYSLAGSWSVSFLMTMPVDAWAQGAGIGLLLSPAAGCARGMHILSLLLCSSLHIL